MDLTKGTFRATVLKDIDPNNQGRYKVQIPLLMHLLPDNVGIFVKNHTHQWRSTNSDVGQYGEYKPLQVGTKVLVKFVDDDINTGYVDKIVSDQIFDTLPFENITDRDDIYQLLRSPKYNNMVLLCEDTEGQPPNSIHLYFNKYRTTLIVDEEGIHIHSNNNRDVEIDEDDQILIKGDRKLEVKGTYDIKVNGNCYVTAPMIYLNSIPATPPTIPTYENSVDKSNGSKTSRLII